MPIIFSSITPHSPLLIETIGRENKGLLNKTNESINKISKQIKEEKIDTILLISSHGKIEEKTFNINNSEEFNINFESFGDFLTKKDVKGCPDLADLIKSDIKGKEDIQLIDKPILNNSTGVPLYLLTKNNLNIETLPIYCSGATLEEHFELGEKIKEKLIKSKKRILILVSAVLSHKLNKNSPTGYSNKAANFDQKIIEYLKSKNKNKIINLNQDLINEVEGNGVKAISILLGIISKEKYNPNLLSYEHPFGVGYLTMILDKTSH